MITSLVIRERPAVTPSTLHHISVIGFIIMVVVAAASAAVVVVVIIIIITHHHFGLSLFYLCRF